MNDKNENNCSKCGIFTSLVRANKSKRTGQQLYRSWCYACEKQRKLDYYEKNKEHICLKSTEYLKQNPAVKKKAAKKWRDNNKESALAATKSWKQKNLTLVLATNAIRKKRVQQQTPNWVNKKELRNWYLNCPPGHHVDHIVPLKGKKVSGLNVPWNLQYLPAEENLMKGNRYET